MASTDKLPGETMKELEQALLSAFGSRTALQRMVRYGLNENLDAITTVQNLRSAVFELMDWAQAHGRLEELIAAALKANPLNPDLLDFATRYGIRLRRAEGSGAAGPDESKPAWRATLPARPRGSGRSPYRTRRSMFRPEQVKQLEKRIDQGDLPGVLTALHQAAAGDEELLRFVTRAQTAVGRSDRGNASSHERRIVHAPWVEPARTEIRQREGSEYRPRGVMLHCAGLSKSWWRLSSPFASCVRTVARALGREPPEAYCRGFSLPAVDLDLRHGKIAGVVGSNGTGKTTLLRMMALDLAPSAGELQLSNKRTGSSDLLRTKVTMVPQAVPRWQGSLLGHLRQQAAFYGFTDEQDNREEVDTAVDLLGLESHVDMHWDELSGGYRTRSAIAAALVARPGLLVLDEPLAMLDPRAQQNLLRALRDRADYGTTAIVVSSQHVPEIESIADVMIALTPGEEKAEIRWPALVPESTGHLFELGIRGPDDELQPRLRELEEHGDVAGFVPGVRSAVVYFEGTQTILGVIEALEGPGPHGGLGSGLEVYHVRDLTNSMVARQYADITKGRRRIGAGDPEPGTPPRGTASGEAT